MRVELHHSAGEHEQYTPHAFDGIIGREVPFKIEGAERGRATVVAVKVDEDGRGATWTVDIADGHPDWHPDWRRAPGRWSFRLPT